MAKKENRGGNLSNEQIEKELEQKGGAEKTGRNYIGSQDTGDDKVRGLGTQVQQRDGFLEGGEQTERGKE